MGDTRSLERRILPPDTTTPNSPGLCGGNRSNGPLASQTGSKWEQALQRLGKEDREQFNVVRKSLDEPWKVLEGVLAVANERKEECIRKRWKLVINRRTIYIRDILEKLSLWVKKIVTIGDVAIQYDPVHAALPWAAVRFILQTSINDLENFGHVIVSLENLASIVSQCHIIETVYLGKRAPKTPELASQLTGSVVNLYAAILQYLADIIQYFTSSTGNRILKSIGHSQEDFQAKYLPVEHALGNFGRLAGVAQAANLVHGLDLIESIDKQLKDMNARYESEPEWLKPNIEQLRQPIDRIDIRLKEIEDGLRREDRVRILRAISNIPHGTHHKIASKGRVEGTGAWFLKRREFKEWRTSSWSSVLWLHGIPGSGKTKLTSLVIDELVGHEHVAYFYCMRNPVEPQRAQCDKILGSLVRQLATVGPNQPILGPVGKCYEDAVDGAGEFEDQAWTTDESVEVLLQLFDEYPAVTLVLDALDEVCQDNRQELLGALGNLIRQSNSLVRIFISSRSNYDIALSLTGAPNIYIGADDNAEDISSFIDKKLAEAKLLHGNLSPSLRNAIVNTLKDGAKGMFRWVDLQIQSLRPLKVAADVRTRLGALPTTLEASYWEIYEQIKDSGENALALATFTFQWLLYAKEPMSLHGVASLASVRLAMDLDTKYTAVEVLDVCSNLIVKRAGHFEFAHLSVREFFERLSNRRIDTYLPEEGHAALAQACLLLLNQALVPGKATRERIEKCMLPRGLELESNSEEDSSRARWRTSKHLGTLHSKALRAYYKLDNIGSYMIDFLQLNAVLLHDIDGVPSEYAVKWMVYHVDAAGSLRLKPEFNNLLKAFLLQPAKPVLEETPGHTTSFYTVAPSFNVWCHLAHLPYVTGWVGLPMPASDYVAYCPGNPIWLACGLEWLELVEYLYQNPYEMIDAELHVSSKLNPFWHAIAARRMELANCIATFTRNKRQTFAEKNGFRSLLDEAVKENDTELVKQLAKLHPGDYETAISAFTEATFLGHHEAMGLILQPPLTPIERAVKAQVDPDSLTTACANGSVETVKSLIENATTNTTGNRFLYLAVSKGHVEVVRLLLEKRIGLGGISTALTIAVSRGDEEIADMLIQYGGEKDSAAVPKAMRFNKPQVVLHLIAAGYEVNERYQGSTALHYATRIHHCGVIAALLAKQAEVNAFDEFKWMPLHLAIDRPDYCMACVEILIRSGADLLAEDLAGRTTLKIAQRRGHDIAELIGRHIQDFLVESCRLLFGEA
ncbi:hypothetical protein F4803DRAFT_528424 [Xylaria telfairii]|nr:hypothetical protein F4803DRAFT_528424 [Xylaria telfairii]